MTTGWARVVWYWLGRHTHALQGLAAIVAIIGVLLGGFFTILSLLPNDYPDSEEIQLVSREIAFRVTQVDEVLQTALQASSAAAQMSDEELLDIIEDGRLSANGAKLRRLFMAALQLIVVADLGGISTTPRTDEHATVWVRGTGWSNSHLPRGRGYRDDKFGNSSLPDVLNDHASLTGTTKANAASFSAFLQFDAATKPNPTINVLPGIASNALTMRLWSERVDLATIKNTTAEVVRWVESVDSSWAAIKSLLPDLNRP